jgi:LemA protein
MQATMQFDSNSSKGATVGFIVFLVLLALLVFWLISIYNGLVGLRNQFKNSFSQIDVQLKRRYDLIPNLVETAKGYIKHERETLEAVIAARNLAYTASQRAAANPADADAMKGLQASEGQLTGALSRFMAVSEAYPELKANTTMLQLGEELTSTENKISFARQAYNDAVTEFNTRVEVFPNSVIAGLFNFHPAELLQATEAPEERKAVKVQF